MPSRSPSLDGRGFTPAVNAGTAPRRHQRSRRKGVRTPDEVIYVGRPTVYGNPFNFKRFGHARSVALYRCWIERRIGALSLGRLGFGPHEIDALFRWRHRLDAELPRLVGADLQCWCPVTSRWCHADVLMAHVAAIDAQRLAA